MSSMKKRAAGRSRLRSILGLALGVVGLWFGFAVLNLTNQADLGGGEKALRIVFGIVWFTFWVGAMVYNVLNLYSQSRSKRTESQPAAATIVAAGPGDRQGEPSDFEARLRKLESLRKDGLVSEDEYQRKRGEFLREKW
ncbi:MAG: SHOCT domain-containing protein [Candidatus Aminicenantales bacterium]